MIFLTLLEEKDHRMHYGEFGFSVISHIDDEWITDKIPKYYDENKNKVSLYLKRGKCRINKDEFLDKSTQYFDQQLKGIIEQDVFSIPYVDDEYDGAQILSSKFNTIMKTMKQWCNDSNQEEGEIKGIVIYGFCLDSYLKFLTFPEHIFKRNFDDSGKEELKEMIIVFNPSERLIFLIRLANPENLASGMKLSTNDTMKFTLLFFDVLKNSGVRVVNLLVTDRKLDQISLKCDSCNSQVILMESLESSKSFKGWLRTKNENLSVSILQEDISEYFIRDFSAKLLFLITTSKISKESHFYGMLPLRSEIPLEQIEEANIPTSKELRIIHSKCKRHIVFSTYGSGISMVARKRAEIISERIDNEILHFICSNKNFQLLAEKNISNVKLSCNEHLKNVFDIIKDIFENDSSEKKIHVVAEHYDTEQLSHTQVRELKDMINVNEKLRDSYIFLACGTTIKDRMIKNRHGQFISTSEWNTHLDMKKEILQFNKRNTVEINELVVSTAEELKDQTAIFNLPYEDTRKNQYKEEFKTQSEVHGRSSRGEPGKCKSKRNKKRNRKQNIAPEIREIEGGSPSNDHRYFTFDETFEFYYRNNDSASSVGESIAREIVKSQFKNILEPSQRGLKIKSVKPSIKIINHAEGSNEEFKILSLSNILGRIIDKTYRDKKDYKTLGYRDVDKHVVLHFDMQSNVPYYFHIAFTMLGKREKVTDRYEEFHKNEDKEILICNYRSFRGFENPSVIVVIDPSLYHLKFCIPECLSRATVFLEIIVMKMLASDEFQTSQETFQRIISKWEIQESGSEPLFSPCPFSGPEAQTSEDIKKIRNLLASEKEQMSHNENKMDSHLTR